jgi:RHS repeat-associated protein
MSSPYLLRAPYFSRLLSIVVCGFAQRSAWFGLAVLILLCRENAGAIVLSAHQRDDLYYGLCSVNCGNDSVCFYLSASISNGAAPGDYCYRLYTENGVAVGQDACVRVNSDGTWSYIGNDPGLACPGGARKFSLKYEATGEVVGVVSTEDGGLVCGCDVQHYDVSIPVPIGTHTVAPEYSKITDKKEGGDQCQPEIGGSADPPQMARYSAHAMLGSLNIEDTPLRYAPPIGSAINFTVTYNQREDQQPTRFNVSSLGPKWTFNWLSYVTDDPNDTAASATIYVGGGGAEPYTGFDWNSQSYRADPQSHAVLVRTSPTTYEKRYPDGWKQVFGLSDGSTSKPRKVFMTQWVDPVGNAVTIGYDASLRVTNITDALGQATTVAYELAGDPLKVTKVTEPFPTGRSASFAYNGIGQLVTITDEIGIQSHFTYAADGSNFITSLQTPYGVSNFATGQSSTSRWIEMTDPLGGKERVEYREKAPGINPSDSVAPAGVTNSGLDVANTFYWNKKALEMYPPVNGVYDYTKAKVTHWCSNSDGTTSGIVASEKSPLENRVWYSYDGQSDTNHAGPSANPTKVARILGDGSTQSSLFEYSNIGNRTKATDPIGRSTSYIYDSNNVDVLEIRQTTGTANELLRKFTYNAQHEPLSDVDAAGQAAIFTYNRYGQLLTRKNAKNETTTFGYGDGTSGHPLGYVTSITSPLFNGVSAVTAFTYDSANRLRTVADPDSHTTITDYDNLDRPIQVTYPDGTNQVFQYTQDFGQGPTTILDLTKTKDRRGLWTTRHYNANRQMDSITDPQNRATRFGWCSCGSLTSITDPKNQVTTFNRDLQRRVYQKVFADSSAISYLYDGQTTPNTPGASSRLKSVTDAKNQRTNYSYFADDNIQQISYTSTSGQPLTPPTPSVNFTYDPNYNRVKTMVDGTGATIYEYHPITFPPALGAGQLMSIDGPLLNDTIAFGYDELGRVVGRSINGAANASSWAFDSLGRVTSSTNKLGTFSNTYFGVTDRLSKLTYPRGASANYLYFPNAQDKRLEQIKYLTPKNILISEFDYSYDSDGQILTWTKNYSGLNPAPQRFDLSYDSADQLIGARLKNASTNALIKQYTYGYDFASNRTSELVGTVTTNSTPNVLNELVSQSGGINRTLTYDANGSLINDGSKRRFEWDAANRLIGINYTGSNNRTEFAYDGLSRMVKIVEKSGTTIKSTRKFVWCGMERCEYRDANDAVTLHVYSEGQYSGTTPYYYTRDHLGSIREMLKSDGNVVGRFDYDPYGRSTTVKNTVPDFNFTGLYRHSASNIDFAVYRAYDPDLGRWLSRDPIGESGGLNLYGYVANGPTGDIDPLGHDVIVLLASKAVWWQGHIATLIGNNETGWYYYSRNGYDRSPWLFGPGDFSRDYFRAFEDFKSSDYSAQYDYAYQIKTGADRDAAMIEYAEEHYNERYHSIIPQSNNCADLVEETLAYGGIPIPGNNQYSLRFFPGIFAFGYIGSPEVPKFLFRNITGTGAGHLWQVPP